MERGPAWPNIFPPPSEARTTRRSIYMKKPTIFTGPKRETTRKILMAGNRCENDENGRLERPPPPPREALFTEKNSRRKQSLERERERELRL